jgi:hypothetical protein
VAKQTQYLYSPSTNGFYLRGQSSVIPADAVSITDEEHAACAGKVLLPGPDGKPLVQDPLKLTEGQFVLQQIAKLEADITPRRLREAVLGIDDGWLDGIDSEISALRAKL